MKEGEIVETYQAYKVRIYPTKEQAGMIMQFIGNSRFVYNQIAQCRVRDIRTVESV